MSWDKVHVLDVGIPDMSGARKQKIQDEVAEICKDLFPEDSKVNLSTRNPDKSEPVGWDLDKARDIMDMSLKGVDRASLDKFLFRVDGWPGAYWEAKDGGMRICYGTRVNKFTITQMAVEDGMAEKLFNRYIQEACCNLVNYFDDEIKAGNHVLVWRQKPTGSIDWSEGSQVYNVEVKYRACALRLDQWNHFVGTLLKENKDPGIAVWSPADIRPACECGPHQMCQVCGPQGIGGT